MRDASAAQCAGKQGFETPQLAQKVAGRRKQAARHYRCPHCGKYHIGGSDMRFKLRAALEKSKR